MTSFAECNTQGREREREKSWENCISSVLRHSNAVRKRKIISPLVSCPLFLIRSLTYSVASAAAECLYCVPSFSFVAFNPRRPVAARLMRFVKLTPHRRLGYSRALSLTVRLFSLYTLEDSFIRGRERERERGIFNICASGHMYAI